MGLVARRTGRMLARGLSARLHEALLRIGDALTLDECGGCRRR